MIDVDIEFPDASMCRFIHESETGFMTMSDFLSILCPTGVSSDQVGPYLYKLGLMVGRGLIDETPYRYRLVASPTGNTGKQHKSSRYEGAKVVLQETRYVLKPAGLHLALTHRTGSAARSILDEIEAWESTS